MAIKSVPEAELGCLERYRRIIYLVRICARMVGADITEPDYQINWVTYILMTLIFNFYCCTAYTIYVSITNDADLTEILQTTCFIGGAIQGSVKLICFVTQRVKVREAQSFLYSTFEVYEKRENHYQEVLLESIAISMRCIKVFIIIYVTVVAALTGFPLIYYAVYNKKILIMQFLLPGLDHNTNSGYVILSAIHVASISVGAFGNFASDMYYLIFIGNVPLLKNILRCKFEDLNKLLQQQAQPTEEKLRKAMVDIVLWHKEYLRLLHCIQSIFFVVILAQIFSSAASVLSTMYCMLVGAWPAAPVYLFFSFVNLYLYCGMGTVVDKSNDDCTRVIYTQCNWYKLPMCEQNYLLLMLRKSQATPSLTVGNMMPLTVGTALQLTKAVYSLVMILMRNVD